MKRLAFLLASLALAACAPMQWTKSETSADQAAADLRACREQAWRATSWGPYGYWYGGIGPFSYYDPFGRRLYPWPYYGVPYANPFDDRFMEEARLTDFCMRAKGYELTPAEK
jgi:hypothetical protein